MSPKLILIATCLTFLSSIAVGYKVGQHCDPAEYATIFNPGLLNFAQGIEHAINSIFGRRDISKRGVGCKRDGDCTMDNTFVCNPRSQRYERCDEGTHKGKLHLECRNHTCYCLVNAPSSHAPSTVAQHHHGRTPCVIQSDCNRIAHFCKSNYGLDHHCVDTHCCCFSLEKGKCVNTTSLATTVTKSIITQTTRTSSAQHHHGKTTCTSQSDCNGIAQFCKNEQGLDHHCVDKQCCCYSFGKGTCVNKTSTTTQMPTTTMVTKASTRLTTSMSSRQEDGNKRRLDRWTDRINPFHKKYLWTRFFSEDGCNSKPCMNGGFCLENDNVDEGYACLCNAGYIGKNCEQASSAAQSIGKQETNTSPPSTTAQKILSCYQCGDLASKTPCSVSFVYQGQPTTCQNGQFCQTDIYTDSNGQKEIYKRCVSEQTCQHEWLQQSSDKEYCVKYGQVKQTNSYLCSFCCVGSNCNAGIVPLNSTLYGGTRQSY